MGDLNKHKVAISTSMSPTGGPNKHKSVINISNCISSLYECMKILISVMSYAYYNVYMHITYVSH